VYEWIFINVSLGFFDILEFIENICSFFFSASSERKGETKPKEVRQEGNMLNSINLFWSLYLSPPS